MKHKLSPVLAALLTLLLLPGCTTEPATGWVTKGEHTFYKDMNSQYVSGWQEIDGNRYYFIEPDRITGTDFAMVTGWLELEGERYYLDEKGILQTGWANADGKIRCFGDDGRLITGWTEKDGVRCYVNDDGTLGSGWIDDRGMIYYLDENGAPLIGWQEIQGLNYYFQENGCMLTGWAQFEGKKYHFAANGPMNTGWAEIGGKRYRFDDNGVMQTGWMEDGEYRYYFHPDGAPAYGPTEIDGVTYYFTPNGVQVYLVNPWHYLPDGYEVELSYIDEKQQVATVCYDALMRMLADCAAAGHETMVVSGYRTMADQQYLYNRKIQRLVAAGYDWYTAAREGAKEVAIPGTSEHQLGLAVDIVDSSYPQLNDNQANIAAQKWLMENCYKYGFILRYPTGSTAVTGIIYEPWHYRYVGAEVAQDLHQSGLTLEEYLDAVVSE